MVVSDGAMMHGRGENMPLRCWTSAIHGRESRSADVHRLLLALRDRPDTDRRVARSESPTRNNSAQVRASLLVHYPLKSFNLFRLLLGKRLCPCGCQATGRERGQNPGQSTRRASLPEGRVRPFRQNEAVPFNIRRHADEAMRGCLRFGMRGLRQVRGGEV